MNFDGWNFVSYPLERDGAWPGKGTVTALTITMPRQTLHLAEKKDVPNLKIRLQGLCLY